MAFNQIVPATTLSEIESLLTTIGLNVDAILVDTGITIPGRLTDIDSQQLVIRAKTDAIPVLTAIGGEILLDGTVQDVYINNDPPGVFNPIVCKLDLTLLQGAESVRVRLYYRDEPGGAFVLQDDPVPFVGVLAVPKISIDLDPNRYGVHITIEQLAGVPRVIPWNTISEE